MAPMPEVYVSVGSNVDPERHLRAAAVALAARYGVLRLSPVYRNRAVGFEGDDFYNAVIAFDTDDAVADVVAELDRIEAANGRRRGGEKFAPRTLDLDLILYGRAVLEQDDIRIPRAEVTRYDFVLRPLLDLEPELRHPATGEALAGVWPALEQTPPRLHPVEFRWTPA
jgi:2-amino-4-hydroxy-6-hydroxymethyldihydropteridine diphosphokinase